MFCPSCGNKNADDSKFCFTCGLPLERTPPATLNSPQPSTPSILVPTKQPKTMWKIVVGWLSAATGLLALTTPNVLGAAVFFIGLGAILIAAGSSWGDVSRKPKWGVILGGLVIFCSLVISELVSELDRFIFAIVSILLLVYGLYPLWTKGPEQQVK